jgi:hypothetical protein
VKAAAHSMYAEKEKKKGALQVDWLRLGGIEPSPIRSNGSAQTNIYIYIWRRSGAQPIRIPSSEPESTFANLQDSGNRKIQTESPRFKLRSTMQDGSTRAGDIEGRRNANPRYFGFCPIGRWSPEWRGCLLYRSGPPRRRQCFTPLRIHRVKKALESSVSSEAD